MDDHRWLTVGDGRQVLVLTSMPAGRHGFFEAWRARQAPLVLTAEKALATAWAKRWRLDQARIHVLPELDRLDDEQLSVAAARELDRAATTRGRRKARGSR